MPVTKLTIENFKGIGERIEISLRPITLLFGANSAGKSTILQALLYLRELLERQNADADRLMASGASIDLGGFRQFVHGHDLCREVTVGVSLSVDADGLPFYPLLFPDSMEADPGLAHSSLPGVSEVSVEVTVQWDPSSHQPWITGYAVAINKVSIGKIESEPGFAPEITMFDTRHPVFHEGASIAEGAETPDGPFWSEALDEFGAGVEDDHPKRKIPLQGGVIPEWGRALSLVPPAGSERRVEAALAQFFLSQIFVGAGELVIEELRKIRHIGSFRDIPDRRFNIRRSPADDRWANGAAAWDLLHNSDLAWFDKVGFQSLGLGYQIERQTHFEVPAESAIAAFLIRSKTEQEIALTELESLPIRREVENLIQKQRLRLVELTRGVEVDPCDVGVGVSQIIPVVVGAMAPGYRILSVEQPELHIHPAVQCALADVLAKQVIESGERILLLETHSEHLMLRWLRRIREGHEGELPPGASAIKPEHLSVLYVEVSDGIQKITELPVTAEGEFSRKWPKGFFEERAEELF